MLNNPTQKPEWQNLLDHVKSMGDVTLNELFKKDDQRFDQLSIKEGSIFFDYSKQRITPETIQKLCKLATACGLEKRRTALFNGEKINATEERAVLHMAMRRPKEDNVQVDGQNIMPEVYKTLAQMKSFSDDLRSGAITGATGKAIKSVISIGVGGSDLGPRLACGALQNKNSPINVLFVANVDGADLNQALETCDPETTLFIVISKSFGTQETLTNAQSAKKWLLQKLKNEDSVKKHFVGISCDGNAVTKFGIQKEYFFPMNEGVNGRFSLWSAVGLPICIQCGFDDFKSLLEGAYAIDQHFMNAAPEKNIPVLMAVIGIWNRNFLQLPYQAILPYAQNLFYFSAYLQQLEMESNGKTVDKDGQKITDYQTCPVLFGEVGTNGQHSFFQLLHQGSDIIPADFIGFKKAQNPNHDPLINNMLAQSAAMMRGRKNIDQPHKHFDGNRPSSTLLLDELNAFNLGQLIAIYEHKCFVQGIIWNINSFDQFGVELGKELAHQMNNNELNGADSSTKGLYSYIHKTNK